MKQGWEIKKFSDVVWFQEGPGVRKHQYTSEGIKLINVANLVNGVVDLSTSDRYISIEEAYGKYKHFLVDEGDLILASSGIQVEYIEKKMGFIHKEHLPLCMNTSTIRFKALNRTTLDMTFFMYYLKSFDFKIQLKKLITGIAQLNFGPSHLKQMSIPIPPFPEQEKIVAELDCLSGVIEKKKQQLKELDSLAESIFYTMFGDPITNEKGWKIIPLSNKVKVKGRVGWKGYKKEDLRDSGPLAIGGGHLTDNGGIDISNPVYLSIEKYLESPEIMIEVGDIILVQRGTIGKVGLIANSIGEATINPCVLILRPDNLSSVYLLHFFLNASTQMHLKTLIKGVAQPMITQQQVNELSLPIPPLTLQQEFAEKIEAIEKQKELIKESIIQTEELFNSRMDYYFG